ncbi:MAG: response regulator [Actinomycetota bacterium]
MHGLEMRIEDAPILIVDDEPVNVRLLEKVLERGGYGRVTSTTEPREVLSLCRELQPAVLLLDLRMPHLDGFRVLEILDEGLGERQRPSVLFLTADVGEDVKRRALSLGASEFLLKPFDLAQVLFSVGKLVERYRDGAPT